jgi:hypothetical protein
MLTDSCVHIELTSTTQYAEGDLDRAIYDLNQEIDLMSSQADTLDYAVAACSGILCGLLDTLWVGEFDLSRGRNIAKENVEYFVKKSANLLGFEGDDLKAAVRFLEKSCPIP